MYDKLLRQVLPSNYRSVWTTKETNIHQGCMVIEWVITKPVWKFKSLRMGCMHEFIQCIETLVLINRCIWHRPWAGLLQMWEDMNCGCSEVPDNIALCPTVFGNKSLTSMEWWYSNSEREALGILYGLEKFHHCFEEKYMSSLTWNCW